MPQSTQHKLILVSTYPPKGSLHGNKFSAVASYAKNTIDSMYQTEKDLVVEVFADILENESNDYIDSNNVHVNRTWKRNDLLMFVKLLKNILEAKNFKKVLFEFEFGMFGGNKILIALLPFFLLTLRIFGKDVYLVCHGVLLSADEFGDQVGIKSKSIKSIVISFVLKSIYFLNVRFSKQIIVFEEFLRDKLKTISLPFDHKKIKVIAHGVENSRKKFTKKEARDILKLDQDKKLILCFGFLIWYKGSDWLIESFNSLQKKELIGDDYELIMAGGFSKTHEKDPIYQEYISKTESLINQNKNVVFTSFLPESEIDLYFSAADVVILPYRIMISASGPFSFILSHAKSFRLSKSLIGYSLNKDFIEATKSVGISNKDIFFELTEDSIHKSIESISDEVLQKKLESVSEILSMSRSWPEIGKKYIECVLYN